MQPLRRTDPRSVGDYRLLGRIGSGGMGVVYLGESRAGDNVAIKVVKPDLAEDPEFRARFNREATAAARVRSPYTAPVVDADVTAAQPWLATEYIPGPSLAKLVGKYGPLGHDDLVATGEQIAGALVAIHAAGLVHRDVKPGNILMSPDGPRVIDFGIACALESAPLTRTGVTLGSPGFLSPEQVRGLPVTTASDVFSLGATLVHAATGRSAFGAGPADALLYRVVHERADLDGVPPPLAKLLATCLAKEPAIRPTATALRARLHARVQAVERARAADRARVLGRRPAERPALADRAVADSRSETRPDHRSEPRADHRPERALERAPDRTPAHRPPGERSADRAADRAPVERLAIERGSDRPDRQDRPDRGPAPRSVAERPPAERSRPPAPRPPGVPPGAGQDGVPTLRRPGRGRRAIMRRRALVGLAALATLVYIATHPPFRFGGPAGKPAPGRTPSQAGSSLPPTNAADVTPATRFEPAGDTPSVDWGAASYPAPDGGAGMIQLSGGVGALAGRPVTLSQTLPVSFRHDPAEVVVLSPAAGPSGPATQFVYVYDLRGGQPSALSAASIPLGSPSGRAIWSLANGLLVRDETAGSADGGGHASTQYAPTETGSLVAATDK